MISFILPRILVAIIEKIYMDDKKQHFICRFDALPIALHVSAYRCLFPHLYAYEFNDAEKSFSQSFRMELS